MNVKGADQTFRCTTCKKPTKFTIVLYRKRYKKSAQPTNDTQPSEYSTIKCNGCRKQYRTKARYVQKEMERLMKKKTSCPECGSEELHTAYCGKHTLMCLECDHHFYDRATEEFWKKQEEEEKFWDEIEQERGHNIFRNFVIRKSYVFEYKHGWLIHEHFKDGSFKILFVAKNVL